MRTEEIQTQGLNTYTLRSEARKLAGSAKYKVKQCEIVLTFEAKQREFVYLVC